ncbi:MAG: helix-turn-helix domain-containing protein [Oligoflexus sp.]|nr:helix-turn-helix domain-containing protein [Oligoflexus sp.]
MTTEIDNSSEPFVAPKSFGASFREAREQAGFSIERAAMSTRISAAFIDALEHQSFKVLPGEIFGRGFVRNLCRAYGCDAKALVAAYDQAVAVQLAETAQENQKEAKPKPIRYSDNSSRNSYSFDSNDFRRNAGKAWAFARPVMIAVPVLLGILWIAQTAYQSWRSSDKADSVNEAAVAEQPVAPAPLAQVAAVVPAPVAAVVVEKQPVLRGTGIESLDIVVKQPVSVRIGRDKDKQVIETLQPDTYRFQFDEQLRLLVDDMSSVEIKFKGQVIPNKGTKGEKRYMTFAVSESTLAKKAEKPKL